MIRISQDPQGVALSVRVIPRASRVKIGGEHAGSLKVYVTAPPDKGRANEALIEALSESLGIPKSRISIRAGEKSRDKTVFFSGANGKDVGEWLSRISR